MPVDRLLLSVVATVSLIMGGCAATPAVRSVQSIEADLSPYNAVRVTVDAPEHIRGKTGYDVTSTELRREFIANVAASGRFATVGMEAQPGKSLDVQLTITDLNYVSGASRGGFGILAGRAVLDVTMTLKDPETGQMLGAYSAAHASSHAQGAFSPVTSTQITAITKELSVKITIR